MNRIASVLVAFLAVVGTPAHAADTEVPSIDDLPLFSMVDVELKRVFAPGFPSGLQDWLRSETEDGSVTCVTLIRFDAEGHFVEIELSACPDAVIAIAQPSVERAWRRARLVEIPAEGDAGLWVSSRTTWSLR